MIAAGVAAGLLSRSRGTVAYAGGDDFFEETAGGYEEIVVTPSEETQEPEGEAQTANPFTPSGTGTVVDNATNEDGKEFYTIMTPSENVFYLVIDRQRSNENVYFLNAVTEADLMALADIPPSVTPEPTPPPVQPEQPSEPEQPEPEAPNSGSMKLIVIALVIVGAGGAAYYSKIYRPKMLVQLADAYR